MKPNKAFHPDVHLNLNVRGLGQSATLAINETSNRLISEGKPVYKLGLGQSPFPVPEIMVDALKEHAHQKDYLSVMGLPELRESIAEYYRRTEGLETTFDDVLIGPGSKELMFILQLAYYGDLVIPKASWVSYAPQAHIIGRQIHWIVTKESNGWKLLPEELENHCKEDTNRPRIVILNYPSNPCGTTYSSDELKAIAKVARKYRVILLSDEIYGGLHHNGQHISISRYYPEGTIISNGISKWAGSGGWRLGCFVFPKSLHWLRDGMAVVASETFTSTSAPIQYASIKAFEKSDAIENYINNSRKIVKRIGAHMYKEFSKAEISLPKPKGGFYLFPNFSAYKAQINKRGITTSPQLCHQLLLDTGVAILPGSSFGRPKSEFTARLAYVDFDGTYALQKLQELQEKKVSEKEFLDLACPKIMQATTKMIDWFRQL